MLACVDVDYRGQIAVAACLTFNDWQDASAVSQHVTKSPVAGEYRPGRFFERELPALLAILKTLPSPPQTIIIDGYVWLGGPEAPGLGAHLYDALGKKIPIIGAAKTAFKGSSFAERVLRGSAATPLYVTAAGIPATEAAAGVQSMHGPYRVPTLLKAVDRLCRTA